MNASGLRVSVSRTFHIDRLKLYTRLITRDSITRINVNNWNVSCSSDTRDPGSRSL